MFRELLQDPYSNGLLQSFQDSIIEKKIDQKRRTEAYSYIGARVSVSASNWLWHRPSVSMIRLAAQLAWEGHLPSVKYMRLWHIDLSEIPREQMGKLASKVTDTAWINNITPITHLDIILENVRCSKLVLENMRLTEQQTRALVTALACRLKKVTLNSGVNLDFEALYQYNGRGRCLELRRMKDGTEEEWRLECWAEKVGWTVTQGRSELILRRE